MVVQTNPWEILPRELMGDPDPAALYRAVGMALSAWEALDERQYILYSAIVNEPDSARQSAANTAYGTVLAPSGRAEMLLAAAGALFGNDPIFFEIKELVDAVGALAARRNDIARGIVREHTDNEKSLGSYLVPPIYNARRRLNRQQLAQKVQKISPDDLEEEGMFLMHKYAYTAQQVLIYMEHFKTYRQKMMDLIRKTQARCDELFPWRDRLAAQLGQQQHNPETKG